MAQIRAAGATDCRLHCALCAVRSVAVHQSVVHGSRSSPLCDAVLVRCSHLHFLDDDKCDDDGFYNNSA